MHLQDVFKWANEIASSAAGSAAFEVVKASFGWFKRTHAPVRNADAEADYLHVTTLLTPDERRALDGLLLIIGRGYRYADVMQSVRDGVLHEGTPEEKLDSRRRLALHLSEIATAPDDEKILVAVARGFMKETEEEYLPVQLRNAVGRTVVPRLERMAANAAARNVTHLPYTGADPRFIDAQRARWQATTTGWQRFWYFVAHPISSLQRW